MTRNFKSLLALCLVALTLTASCTKSYNRGVAVNATTANESQLNALFAALRPAPQTLVVTAGFLQTVYGANGTKLTFYPNSFKDAKGNIITSGIVTIQLTEIYSVGDMIMNRATTVSGGQLLSSGGEVLITAAMNGEKVYANKYGLGFKQSVPSRQTMYLFYGSTNTPDSSVVWYAPVTPQTGTASSGTNSSSDTNTVVVITTGGLDTVTTFSAVSQYYQFDSCTNFNWINCDYFYTSGAQLTDVSIVMPDTSFNQSNSEVFIVFPTINAAARISGYTAATHTFSLPQGYYVPLGLPVDIAVATNKNGTYYYYQQTGITTTENMVVFPNMAQLNLTDIATDLQRL